MVTVLLLGGGLQSISLARGLKEEGFCIVNISSAKSVGRYSRFIDIFKPCEISTMSVCQLASLLNEIDVDVIIPTEDEYAYWLSNNKKNVETEICSKLAIVDYELFTKVINKNDLLEICKDSGIPHPKTAKLDIENLDAICEYVGFPSLIKPDISNGSRGIKFIRSLDDLLKMAKPTMEIYGSCTLQEFIKNDHYYNVMLYRYADGTYAQYVATKIERFYPVNGGSSSFCHTIANERLVEPCKRLLDLLKWHGFADFDVLEKAENDYRIIEINPRVPASLHAAYVSGVNFGKIIVDDLLRHQICPVNYITGKQLRYLGLDIAWFFASKQRFSCPNSWFKFLGKDLYYQEGGAKDLKVMIYSLVRGIAKQLSPSFRRSKAGMN